MSPHLPSTIPTGTRVEVYWNLHRHCYSVRALDGPRRGRVIAHTHQVRLTDVTLVVQPAGRERVRRQQRKTVHAFVRGRWSARGTRHAVDRITYDPYRDDTFVLAEGRTPITAAREVYGLITGTRPQLFAHPITQGD